MNDACSVNAGKKGCCESCKFWEFSESKEKFLCQDFDGLYFLWATKPTERCPDYEQKEECVE